MFISWNDKLFANFSNEKEYFRSWSPLNILIWDKLQLSNEGSSLSSVDPSASIILRPWVWSPTTTSILFQLIFQLWWKASTQWPVDSCAPAILHTQVGIPRTPSPLYSICVVEIVIDVGGTKGRKRGWIWPIYFSKGSRGITLPTSDLPNKSHHKGKYL